MPPKAVFHNAPPPYLPPGVGRGGRDGVGTRCVPLADLSTPPLPLPAMQPSVAMFPLSAAQVQQFGEAWGLHPQLTVRILWVWWQAHNAGVAIRFVEGHRSHERQAELYAQGRSRPGSIVTNAKPGQSRHNDFPSRAVDLDSPTPGGLRFAGQLGKMVGLEWGGDWKSLKDEPHFQWNP